MSGRQQGLFPESELRAWAQTLLPPARETLQRLQDAAGRADPRELATAVDQHLLDVRAAQRHNEFIDLERAQSLAQAANKLISALNSLKPQDRIVAAAAVLYFVTADDAEDDLGSSVGFDDDEEVLNSALKRLGL